MSKYIYLVLIALFSSVVIAKGVYQQPQAFVAEVIGSTDVKSKVIWLTKEMQQKIASIMGHKYPALRIRYWNKNTETVWVLEEIGKEEPITVGVHINHNKIQQLKVLIYREMRGNEVRQQFFTSQFDQLQLTSETELSESIDGITGATLSVRALKKLSVMALWLASQVEQKSP